MSDPERVSVTRRIAAPARTIFELVTDPHGHVRIDGSGMLVAAAGVDRLAPRGDVRARGLDRPDRLNAFTVTMQDDLIAAFDRTDADDDVRAVVVTGRGRAFCAGADLGAGGSTFDYAVQARLRSGQQVDGVHRDGGGMVTLRIFDSLKPVVAAVNGPAVGVGASMTLPMDARLAA